MNAPELSLVVPAYNEGKHLEDVVKEMARVLEESGIAYEIRVVNNGSRDDTGTVIGKLCSENSRITRVELAVNRGYGGGILAGLAGARGSVVWWIHADGQARPQAIVDIYRKMLADGGELGKAVRIIRYESPWRIIQSRIYHAIFQFLFWTPYRDINGTPKLMTKRALQMLTLGSRDWFLDPEFVIKAMRHKLPVCGVEMTWGSRKSGSTRAHLLTGLEFLKNMILYRLYIK